MSLRRNLLAGVLSSIWSALIGLAVVPLYLRYLGMEAYGLIGFFATTQALLQLLDMGIAPTINREVARHLGVGTVKKAGNLLHTFAVVYWGTAGLIVLLVVALAPLIAGHWLQSKAIPRQTIEHAVMLIGLVAACRWPVGLYQGALMGAQRLALASGVSMVIAALGSFGAVAMLAFVSPTIEAFFMWQAGVGLLYAAAMQSAAWGVIGRTEKVRFDVAELQRVWRFSAGMGGIAVTGLVFTQLDKIIISKALGLQEFGQYMLAGTVVSCLSMLVSPFFNVVYPRFSALVAAGDTQGLVDLYRLSARVLTAFLFPPAMVLVCFSEVLVRVWTGRPDVALSVAPIVSLLAMGSALHGVMYLPYALQLAYGMTALPLALNIAMMVAWVPLDVSLVLAYGLRGGALGWLVLHVVFVLSGTWLTHRSVLKGLAPRWLFRDVGVPLALSVVLVLTGVSLMRSPGHTAYARLVVGVAFAIAATAASLLESGRLRAALVMQVQRLLR